MSLSIQSETFRIARGNSPVSGGQLCLRIHRVCINLAPPTLPVFIQLRVVGGHIGVGLLYDQVGWCGHSYHIYHAIVSVVNYMYLLCTGVLILYTLYPRKRYL